MRTFVLFFLAALLAVGSGCSTSDRRWPDRRPPRRIDWQEPVSVMRGFFAAKKRGDWKSAYLCCDYEETLPKEERATIKKMWKAESGKWAVEYQHTFWIMTAQGYRDDTALVSILVARRDPITHALSPGETYLERLKKYKNKWKVTGFLASEEPE